MITRSRPAACAPGGLLEQLEADQRLEDVDERPVDELEIPPWEQAVLEEVGADQRLRIVKAAEAEKRHLERTR